MSDFSAPHYLHRQFLGGLILFGLIVFAAFLLYDFGLWAVLLAGDKSFVSLVILTLWLAMSAVWLWQFYRLQKCALPLTQEQQQHYARALNHGWLAADMALKLGLVGTILGFILMLAPLRELLGQDINQLRQVLVAMGDGMAVALYTTLAGLVANMLLRLQYQFLGDALNSAQAQ